MSKYLLLLVCFCLLGGAMALGQRPASPSAARQPTSPAGERAPHGPAPAARRYQVRAGAVVFGWYPGWLPARAYEQMDFSLLSHLAYGGYRATDQGHLEMPTHPLDDALATVRHDNPGCKVLLSVEYQEAWSGPGLFAEARLPARQALVAAIVRELLATRADGVNLEFSFNRKPGSPAAKPAPTKQRKEAKKRGMTDSQLKQERITINTINKALQQKAAQLRTQQGSPDYAKKKQALDQAMAASVQRRAVYRALSASPKPGRSNQPSPPRAALRLASPDADSVRVPDWRGFVVLLHQQLEQHKPGAALAITLPAVDSTGSFARLDQLVPDVQLFVLQACDYTAGRSGVPGPLAPLHPSARWGKASISASVDYYLGAEVPASKLVITFPHYGKVWSPPTPPPGSTAVPFHYLENQSLRGLLVITAPLDPASSSRLAQVRSTPARSSSSPSSAPDSAWLEDSTSRAVKYAWVMAHHLGGVGIMALSYDPPAALAWPLQQAGIIKELVAAPIQTTEPGSRPWLHLGLFAAAVLLGFAFLGGLISALLQARAVVPFRGRLVKVAALLGGCLVLLLLYSYFLGPHHGRPLLFACLAGLVLLGAGIAYHRLQQPKELP